MVLTIFFYFFQASEPVDVFIQLSRPVLVLPTSINSTHSARHLKDICARLLPHTPAPSHDFIMKKERINKSEYGSSGASDNNSSAAREKNSIKEWSTQKRGKKICLSAVHLRLRGPEWWGGWLKWLEWNERKWTKKGSSPHPILIFSSLCAVLPLLFSFRFLSFFIFCVFEMGKMK